MVPVDLICSCDVGTGIRDMMLSDYAAATSIAAVVSDVKEVVRTVQREIIRVPFPNIQYVPQMQTCEHGAEDMDVWIRSVIDTESECCDVGIIPGVASHGSLTGQHSPAASEVLG